MAGFSHGQRQAIVVATQTVASLSFVGSAIIVFTNFRFKQLRTYSFQLVVWLAVCDISVNVSFFLGSPADGSVRCTAQAIMQQFFQIALIQWTILISRSLLVVASKTGTFDGRKRMPRNHLWAWGVSALLTLGPLATESFGKSETDFCWIQMNAPWDMGAVWRLAFVLVCALSIVFVVWTYLTVARHLGRAQRGVFLLAFHSSNNSSSALASMRSSASRTSPLPPLIPGKILPTRPTAGAALPSSRTSKVRKANPGGPSVRPSMFRGPLDRGDPDCLGARKRPGSLLASSSKAPAVHHTRQSGPAIVIGSKGGSTARMHPRPFGIRVADGSGTMRKWIRSMSSLDVDRSAVVRRDSHSSSSIESSGSEEIYGSIHGPIGGNGGSEPIRNRSWMEVASHNLGTHMKTRQQARDSGGNAAGGGVVTNVGGGPGVGGFSRATRGRASDMGKLVARVKWYPVIYVLCWTFTLVNGVEIIVVGQQNASLALVLLAMITARLQGLLNFLYYGMNDRLKQAYLQDLLCRQVVASCCRAIGCCSSCSSCCDPRTKLNGQNAHPADTTASINRDGGRNRPTNNGGKIDRENTLDGRVATKDHVLPTPGRTISTTAAVDAAAKPTRRNKKTTNGETAHIAGNESHANRRTAMTMSLAYQRSLSYVQQESGALYRTPRRGHAGPDSSGFHAPGRPPRPFRETYFSEDNPSQNDLDVIPANRPEVSNAGSSSRSGGKKPLEARSTSGNGLRGKHHVPTRFKFNAVTLKASRAREKRQRRLAATEDRGSTTKATTKRVGEEGGKARQLEDRQHQHDHNTDSDSSSSSGYNQTMSGTNLWEWGDAGGGRGGQPFREIIPVKKSEPVVTVTCVQRKRRSTSSDDRTHPASSGSKAGISNGDRAEFPARHPFLGSAATDMSTSESSYESDDGNNSGDDIENANVQGRDDFESFKSCSFRGSVSPDSQFEGGGRWGDEGDSGCASGYCAGESGRESRFEKFYARDRRETSSFS